MADTTVRIKFDAKDNASAPFKAIAENMNNGANTVQRAIAQVDGQLGGIVGKLNGTAKSLQALGLGTTASFLGGLGVFAVQKAIEYVQRKEEEARKAALDAANARIDAGRRVIESLKAQADAFEAAARAAKALRAAEAASTAAAFTVADARADAFWLARARENGGSLTAEDEARRAYESESARIDSRALSARTAGANAAAESKAAKAALANVEERIIEASAQLETYEMLPGGSEEVRKARAARAEELRRQLADLGREKAAAEARVAVAAKAREAAAFEKMAIDQMRKNAFERHKQALDQIKRDREAKAAEDAEKAREDHDRRREQGSRELASRQGALRSDIARSLSATLSQRMAGAGAMGAADVARIRALMANGTLQSVRGGYLATTQDAAERRARKTESYQDEMKRLVREIKEKYDLTDGDLAVANF